MTKFFFSKLFMTIEYIAIGIFFLEQMSPGVAMSMSLPMGIIIFVLLVYLWVWIES